MWRATKPHKPADLIASLSGALESRGLLPKQCELSAIGPLHMAALFNELDPTRAIIETGFCGMDTDQDVAILKALVECAERAAYREGLAKNDRLCLTERSDGFAAFPVSDHTDALARARENALAEAVERFAWATWADDSAVAFSLAATEHPILDAINGWIALKRTFLVKPKFAFQNLELQIHFAELEGGGVVSGGACGKIGDQNTSLRALGELARHASAAKKFKHDGLRPTGTYEERLMYMASVDGAAHLSARLASKGTKTIDFPPLALDGSVAHSLSETVAVHRCYFANQPPFVAGPKERLCL